MAEYRFRYFFDPGGDICLWGADEITKERFGYACDLRSLPLRENTWRRGYYIMAWYDTSIDWTYPPDPLPWDDAEESRFNAAAQAFLDTLRRELGPDFEIIDESGTEN